MSALLTVGVPVFNGGQWLSESLDSILNQTFDGFEIVISDNQSVDDTRQIAEQFAARDDRVRYIRQSANIGIFRNYDAVLPRVTPSISNGHLRMTYACRQCLRSAFRRSKAGPRRY